MRALLDVNVLIALMDADHSLHDSASRWFGDHVRSGWASSPITQNGCVRIMSHPGYPKPVAVRAVMERLAHATSTAHHEFWPDDLSLLDPRVADATRIHGPRQITDLYLLALAVRHDARFVTFDAAIALAAVRGAKSKHLLAL
jgi:toxin-antitoxin system PIN domain toxin